jgi:hypothetical protein
MRPAGDRAHAVGRALVVAAAIAAVVVLKAGPTISK